MKGKGLVVTKNACHCQAHPLFVVRPFRVVHEAKASHYIYKHPFHCQARPPFLSLRGTPSPVIARSGSDEAISYPTEIATLRSQRQRGVSLRGAAATKQSRTPPRLPRYARKDREGCHCEERQRRSNLQVSSFQPSAFSHWLAADC